MRDVWVGIDVSAKSLSVAWVGERLPLREAVFSNDAAGHRALLKTLSKPGRQTRVCLEATGVYGLDVAMVLERGGLAVMIATPKSAWNFAKARSQRGKTDSIDAKMLVEFCRTMPFRKWAPPTKAKLELRAVVRRIHGLTKQKTVEKNRLHAAKATGTTPAFLIEDFEDSIAQLEKRIGRLEGQALIIIEEDEQLNESFELLQTVTGVAKKTAIRLLGEFATLPDDMTVRQWVAWAGLDPRPRQSGKYVGKTRISKMGNAHVRSALYMPAMTALRHLEPAKQFHERLVARGKASRQATVAVMRKLLHAMWAILKYREPFQPEKCFPEPAKAKFKAA